MAQRSHAYGSTAAGRQDAAARGKDNRRGKWQRGQANTVEQGKQTSGGDIGKKNTAIAPLTLVCRA